MTALVNNTFTWKIIHKWSEISECCYALHWLLQDCWIVFGSQVVVINGLELQLIGILIKICKETSCGSFLCLMLSVLKFVTTRKKMHLSTQLANHAQSFPSFPTVLPEGRAHPGCPSNPGKTVTDLCFHISDSDWGKGHTAPAAPKGTARNCRNQTYPCPPVK